MSNTFEDTKASLYKFLRAEAIHVIVDRAELVAMLHWGIHRERIKSADRLTTYGELVDRLLWFPSHIADDQFCMPYRHFKRFKDIVENAAGGVAHVPAEDRELLDQLFSRERRILTGDEVFALRLAWLKGAS